MKRSMKMSFRDTPAQLGFLSAIRVSDAREPHLMHYDSTPFFHTLLSQFDQYIHICVMTVNNATLPRRDFIYLKKRPRQDIISKVDTFIVRPQSAPWSSSAEE